jgi:hypothetical protein
MTFAYEVRGLMKDKFPRTASLWKEYIPPSYRCDCGVSRCLRDQNQQQGRNGSRRSLPDNCSLVERCKDQSFPHNCGIRKTMYAVIRHFDAGLFPGVSQGPRQFVVPVNLVLLPQIWPNPCPAGASPAGLQAIELTFVDAVTSRDYRKVTREPFTEGASASILLIEGSSGGGLPGACNLRVGRRFFFWSCY